MDTLKKQRASARKYALDSSLCAVFLAILCAVSLLVMRERPLWSRLCVAVIFGAILAYFLYLTGTYFAAYRTLQALKTCDTVLVHGKCNKIKLSLAAESRFTSHLFAVVFVCEDGGRYVYVPPHAQAYEKGARASLRDTYEGKEICLRCYKESFAVCSVEKPAL